MTKRYRKTFWGILIAAGLSAAGLFLAVQMGWVPPLTEPKEEDRAARAAERVTPELRLLYRRAFLAYPAPVFLRIYKQERILELFGQGADGRYQLVKTYAICNYSGGLGPKLREGDGQSPEGFYAVTKESLNPRSRFHLSFNLGFPNAYDKALGRTGSFLMVHGDCQSIGCYAMTDPLIEEIYTAVAAALKAGQDAVPVHIYPFRMTDQALAERRNGRWREFWFNLKQGHDFFEIRRYPPRVHVLANRYVFEDGGRQRAEQLSAGE